MYIIFEREAFIPINICLICPLRTQHWRLTRVMTMTRWIIHTDMTLVWGDMYPVNVLLRGFLREKVTYLCVWSLDGIQRISDGIRLFFIFLNGRGLADNCFLSKCLSIPPPDLCQQDTLPANNRGRRGLGPRIGNYQTKCRLLVSMHLSDVCRTEVFKIVSIYYIWGWPSCDTGLRWDIYFCAIKVFFVHFF